MLVDIVRQEAQTLLALTNAQTPLLGGDNEGLDRLDQGTGFEGATPRRSVTATPNPMLTPRHSSAGTPAGSHQNALVVRDNFGINESATLTPVTATPSHEERYQVVINTHMNSLLYNSLFLFQEQIKHQLAQGLASLPAPKNDFVIVVPEEEEEEEDIPDGVELSAEDAAERDRKIQEQIEEEGIDLSTSDLYCIKFNAILNRKSTSPSTKPSPEIRIT